MEAITDDDFIVTDCPSSAFADYDRACGEPGDMPDHITEAYAAELQRILIERPSPAAVAEALARGLEGPGGEVEAAAWWLVAQLGGDVPERRVP